LTLEGRPGQCAAFRPGELRLEDGLVTGGYGYTITDAVRDWLAFGLSGRDSNTITKCTILANTHTIPALGARKLRDLSADDIVHHGLALGPRRWRDQDQEIPPHLNCHSAASMCCPTTRRDRKR
jgi:hypothetical protein